MPSSTPELQDEFMKTDGEANVNDGIMDCEELLKAEGINVVHNGMIMCTVERWNNATDKAKRAMTYLVEEWDYGFYDDGITIK